MTRSWLIDELRHAGPEHLDPDFVERYDRKQGHPSGAPDLAVFQAHGLTADSTVIDFGAGTGQFALPAAGYFAHVIAVDISPAMIRTMRARAEESGLRNLDCVQAGFLSYEHRGQPVDGVYTRNALHHLPDFFKGIALGRIAHLLRPHGLLRLQDLVFDFRPTDADAALERWFNGAQRDPSAGYTADDFVEHVRTEFSTYSWLLEPMLVACGFQILDVEFAGSIYGSYTCEKKSSTTS